MSRTKILTIYIVLDLLSCATEPEQSNGEREAHCHEFGA